MGVTQYDPRTDADAEFVSHSTDYCDALAALTTTFNEYTPTDISTSPTDIEALRATIPERAATATRDETRHAQELSDWWFPVRAADVADASRPAWVDEWPYADTTGTFDWATAEALDTVRGHTTAGELLLEGLTLYTDGDATDYKIITSAELQHSAPETNTRLTLSIDTNTSGTVGVNLVLQWYGTTARYFERESVFDLTEADVEQVRDQLQTLLTVGSYATPLAADTTLSPQEAAVHLLDDIGYSAAAIGDLFASSRSTIASVKQRAEEKYADAPDRIAQNQRTRRLFDDYSAGDILSGAWE